MHPNRKCEPCCVAFLVDFESITILKPMTTYAFTFGRRHRRDCNELSSVRENPGTTANSLTRNFSLPWSSGVLNNKSTRSRMTHRKSFCIQTWAPPRGFSWYCPLSQRSTQLLTFPERSFLFLARSLRPSSNAPLQKEHHTCTQTLTGNSQIELCWPLFDG